LSVCFPFPSLLPFLLTLSPPPTHYPETKLTIKTTGNILPDSTAAPAIQGQARELEKHMRKDSLNEKILHRPKPEDLIKEGILTEDPTSIDEGEGDKAQAEKDKLYEERIEEEYAKREGGA
jgi:hypothetical protein